MQHVRLFISFLVYAAWQVLILKNVVLFNVAFCFIYVSFILYIPIKTSRMLTLLLAFCLGLIVDLFYGSLGLHAMALVAMAFIREPWLSVVVVPGGYDDGVIPSIRMNGTVWFLLYCIPLVFVHHVLVFYGEAVGFHLFWHTFFKVMSSLFLTVTGILIVQFLAPNKQRI